MGSIGSPVVTSYRLPIVTIGLSLTVSQCSDLLRQTHGRTDGKRRQFYRTDGMGNENTHCSHYMMEDKDGNTISNTWRLRA